MRKYIKKKEIYKCNKCNGKLEVLELEDENKLLLVCKKCNWELKIKKPDTCQYVFKYGKSKGKLCGEKLTKHKRCDRCFVIIHQDIDVKNYCKECWDIKDSWEDNIKDECATCGIKLKRDKKHALGYYNANGNICGKCSTKCTHLADLRIALESIKINDIRIEETKEKPKTGEYYKIGEKIKTEEDIIREYERFKKNKEQAIKKSNKLLVSLKPWGIGIEYIEKSQAFIDQLKKELINA